MGWLLAIPVVFASYLTVLGLSGVLSDRAFAFSALALVAVWAVLGGMIVRPTAPLREAALVGLGLTAFLAALFLVTVFVAGIVGASQPADDNGNGVGFGVVLIVTPVPFVACAVAGRLARRVIGRMARSARPA